MTKTCRPCKSDPPPELSPAGSSAGKRFRRSSAHATRTAPQRQAVGDHHLAMPDAAKARHRHWKTPRDRIPHLGVRRTPLSETIDRRRPFAERDPVVFRRRTPPLRGCRPEGRCVSGRSLPRPTAIRLYSAHLIFSETGATGSRTFQGRTDRKATIATTFPFRPLSFFQKGVRCEDPH